jgi:hypothetical protein
MPSDFPEAIVDYRNSKLAPPFFAGVNRLFDCSARRQLAGEVGNAPLGAERFKFLFESDVRRGQPFRLAAGLLDAHA